MQLKFKTSLWYWRGPAPFHFLTVPEKHAADIKEAAKVVSYGWGMVPVKAQIGKTVWTTAMFAKNGSYVLPVKNDVRLDENLIVDEEVEVKLWIES